MALLQSLDPAFFAKIYIYIGFVLCHAFGVCVCVWVGGCVSVAIATVKHPVLLLYVEDGHCRNFLY